MDKILYQRTVSLLEAELGDELVALDATEGNCFGFNSVATSVWRQLVSPKSFSELQGALLAEYEVGTEHCAEELQGLLNDLVEKGLVRVRADAGPPSMAAPED